MDAAPSVFFQEGAGIIAALHGNVGENDPVFAVKSNFMIDQVRKWFIQAGSKLK